MQTSISLTSIGIIVCMIDISCHLAKTSVFEIAYIDLKPDEKIVGIFWIEVNT